MVFAFWGAEENDLDGSRHYVDELSETEKDQTSAYLNVDMAASPNGIRSFHDGDGSDFGDGGPEGSKEIEDVFFRFFEANSLPAETTPFEDGDSDYDAFLRAGIPAGGLFSGDEESKTDTQAQAYGGTPGRDLDPCYHEACDTLSNIDRALLQEMSGALAYVTAAYALAPGNERARDVSQRRCSGSLFHRPMAGRGGEQVQLSHDNLFLGARPDDALRG